MKSIRKTILAILMLLIFIFSTSISSAMAGVLINAAESGDIDQIKRLITNGANINEKDEDGWTPLIMAAEGGNKAVVELLISKGANVNAKNNYGATPLHKVLDATRPATKPLDEARKAIAELLITKEANVNAKGFNNTTPLHLAAMRGEISLVKVLIAKGADVNAKTQKGRTALFLAKYTNQMAVVELLKNHRVQLPATGKMISETKDESSDGKAQPSSEDSGDNVYSIIGGLFALFAFFMFFRKLFGGGGSLTRKSKSHKHERKSEKVVVGECPM